jgi:hypothetical protein
MDQHHSDTDADTDTDLNAKSNTLADRIAISGRFTNAIARTYLRISVAIAERVSESNHNTNWHTLAERESLALKISREETSSGRLTG